MMITAGLLAAGFFLASPQTEPEQWKSVLATREYSVAIRFDAPSATGLTTLTILTTETVPPQSPPLAGQRWAQIEVECADDNTGAGKVRLLGEGAIEASSSPRSDSPGRIPDPQVYAIGGRSPVSWVAENFCSNRLTHGAPITGEWVAIPAALRERHDAMLAAPSRISVR